MFVALGSFFGIPELRFRHAAAAAAVQIFWVDERHFSQIAIVFSAYRLQIYTLNPPYTNTRL